MALDKYPEATWLGNGASAGRYTGGPWKVVLHTTETAGLPGYKQGKTAPHLTYAPKSRRWYQHTLLSVASRSLVNAAGGAQTNRDSVINVEIICYSNGPLADKAQRRLWVGDLPDYALADIRDFLLWTAAEFGVVMKWRGKQAFSYAEANAPEFRMTRAEWDNYGGVCAHHDVPEGNLHWDTGALNWHKLMEDEEMSYGRKENRSAPQVRIYQEALLGWKADSLPTFGADGDYGDETYHAVRGFQAWYGLPSTGIIDPDTARFLAVFHPRTPAGAPGPPGADGRRGPKGSPGAPGPKGDTGDFRVVVEGKVV